jgi:hypothetical protein
VNDLPSLQLHLTFLASLALTCDLDVCRQRLIPICRNSTCKLRFVSCDELQCSQRARVHCNMSAHVRNTNTEPLSDWAASSSTKQQTLFNDPHLPTDFSEQPATLTLGSHNGRLPTPPRSSPQNNVLAIPRRRAQIHIGAQFSRPKLLFFATNPRALQHRNTEEFWLPRSFAKTVRIVQDFQTTAFPGQSDAAAEAERYALADLLF